MCGNPSFSNDAEAVDETRINNKITAADAKVAECNVLLVFIILFLYLSFIFK